MGGKRKYYLHNHLSMKIEYHKPEKSMFSDTITTDNGQTLSANVGNKNTDENVKRVVKFEIEPFSVRHTVIPNKKDPTKKRAALCTDPTKQQLVHLWDGYEMDISGKDETSVTYTYDVIWIENKELKWASRWDVYLNMGNRYKDDVHWFSIINSLLIVLFLTMMVAMIMMRTLYRDLQRYNRVPTDEEKAEEREESGWKLVHADVFRPPQFPTLFSVCVGTGLQLSGMTSVVVVFAALGFLSPANRGSLVSALMVLFVLMGIVGGYFSARMYKTLNGQGYQKTTLLTAFGFPLLCFATFFLINIFVWAEGSSAAVPFSSMLAVCALWFGISVPLCFLGAFMGYRRDPYEHPVRTSEIPRQIPEQPWYMHPVCTIAVAGILPFGAVFVELYFILNSIWFDRYYYVFGFLLLVVLILAITVAELTIVLNYLQLCGEDYRWWWQSFFAAGSVAFYVFLYSLYYFSINSLMTKFTSLLVFFSYTTLMSAAMFLITGSFGFSATYLFNRAIYGAIKVD